MVCVSHPPAQKGCSGDTPDPVRGAASWDPGVLSGQVMRDVKHTAGIAVGGLGLPDEVAWVRAFMSSERAGFLTGETIHAKGSALAG